MLQCSTTGTNSVPLSHPPTRTTGRATKRAEPGLEPRESTSSWQQTVILLCQRGSGTDGRPAVDTDAGSILCNADQASTPADRLKY